MPGVPSHSAPVQRLMVQPAVIVLSILFCSASVSPCAPARLLPKARSNRLTTLLTPEVVHIPVRMRADFTAPSKTA
ncbi:hypothetical protein MPL3356_110260 [Mesorhizobium plurifarium]|uniref:Uncharacterized protein n=1 Tax=Mesorhizobium plurifarium TaxID=69974 RepID=A0A090DET7_MESPL|nr:hypothetical protein MPL3356_110260 [Mesorhizobium plurifarium]